MLSIKSLTKIYKLKGGSETRALDGVSLDFPEKGMIFLLGKSGSGKSTLLNLIGGLDFPTSGEIILKGRSSKDFSQTDFDSYRNTYIGFVFQEYNILNEFNVEQNLALAIELQNKKVNKDEVNNLLEQVDLKDFAKRKPNTLSGGQKQRIAIARALIKSPHIIMADEPTGALDSKTGEQVFETLKKLSSDKLVIVVSHDRDFAERFGDRIIELKDGKVVSDETKIYKKATAISENVSIINDHAISIKDAKKLTKADFDKLYDTIKKSDGKVFISSGENANKSMKVARISESGTSDEFINTKPVEVKQYDAKETKFIKSRMPLGKAIKMGLSGLKTKPIRLAFTIFLSIASFSMFGVVSSLMLYNSSTTYSDALRRTDYSAELIRKEANGTYRNFQMDFDGNVVGDNAYSYSSKQQVQFGIEELETLNANNLGLEYIGVQDVWNSFFPFNNITMTKNSDYYNSIYRIRAISDVSKTQFETLDYELIGNYPTEDNEILLSNHFGKMLIDSGAVSYTSVNQIVGKEFSFYSTKGSKRLKISGFFTMDDIPEKYNKLIDESATVSDDEKRELQNDLTNFWEQSFNSVAFMNSNLFDQYTENSSNNYIPSFSRKGANFDYTNSVWDWDVDAESWTQVRTEVIVEKFPDVFKFYDLSGNKIPTFSLNDDQVFVSKEQIDQYKKGQLTNVLNVLFWSLADEQIQKLMPTFANYMSVEANRDEFRDIQNDMWQDPERALNFFKQYENEYKLAYKVKTLAGVFQSNPDFDTKYDEDTKALVRKINEYESTVTTTEFNTVKQLLTDNFDADIPNYFYQDYLERIRGIEEVQSTAIYNNYAQYVGWENFNIWSHWSQYDLTEIKTYLESNYDRLMANLYGGWEHNIHLNGFTYATREYIRNDDFNTNNPEYLYYKTSTGTKGQLAIKGYYETNDTVPLMTKATAKALTNPVEDNYNWVNTFESDYVAPIDSKYGAAFVKTEYTFDQVNFMNKSFDNYTYSLTSPKYVEVNMIVSLIDMLKTIFLWTGVGFGVFAALMLLNFITISISSKKKDIGILRAIGARKIDVFKIFFSESLFIAAICAVVSIGLSIMAEVIINNYIQTQIGLILLSFGIINIALILGAAIIVSLIATIFPVLHSSRKPPVEAIRAL